MNTSPRPKRILLIEDEHGLVVTLTDRLLGEGYSVDSAPDGVRGEKLAREGTWDIIILDVMLPHKGGLEVCRDLRGDGIATPILMLTARGEVYDRVVGLKLGADDYLTKPFEMIELLARIESLLRRPALAPNVPGCLTQYRFGSVEVDFRTMTVRRADETPVELSAREFQLLRYFIEHRGEVLSREIILNGVWGYDAMPNTRTIDTHVTWLRQKIEENPRHPQYILTVYGVGYRFAG
ncbi:MAG: response regulator transcription factor [Bacteroidetes bacterium]|nr:response regulator transcription factor [Bacteroidota bacterium]